MRARLETRREECQDCFLAAMEAMTVEALVSEPPAYSRIMVRSHAEGCPAGVLCAALSMIQDILVATNGSVTDLLEICTGERIEALKLNEQTYSVSEPIKELEAAPGERIVARRVLLRGRPSAVPLLYAESLIVLGRLPLKMAHQLLNSSAPIGKLLAEHRLETFREILRVWVQPAGKTSALFSSLGPEDLLVARSYRILAGRKPIMLITERFPQLCCVARAPFPRLSDTRTSHGPLAAAAS